MDLNQDEVLLSLILLGILILVLIGYFSLGK